MAKKIKQLLKEFKVYPESVDVYIFLQLIAPLLVHSAETREALLDWSKHDDEAERFCVVDGASRSNSAAAEKPNKQIECILIATIQEQMTAD